MRVYRAHWTLSQRRLRMRRRPPHGAAWQADRILFLGNSVTLHAPKPEYRMDEQLGHGRHRPGERLRPSADYHYQHHDWRQPYRFHPEGSGGADNIVNIAGTFEQNFATYSNSQLQTQIDYRANLVVLQFGENMPSIDSDAVKAAYKSSLESLMNGLQASSNPYIFVTSESLASNPAVDAIKQEVCTEDLTHRIFVDMSAFRNDWTNRASAEGVFSDPGVQATSKRQGDAVHRGYSLHRHGQPCGGAGAGLDRAVGHGIDLVAVAHVAGAGREKRRQRQKGSIILAECEETPSRRGRRGFARSISSFLLQNRNATHMVWNNTTRRGFLGQLTLGLCWRHAPWRKGRRSGPRLRLPTKRSWAHRAWRPRLAPRESGSPSPIGRSVSASSATATASLARRSVSRIIRT